MAPVTMVGAVTQSIAEALIAIVLIQIINPGCPCAIGTFTSNVDMKTGAPAFGTPDYMRATQMTGQMARFYGLPLRSSNACASNTPDAQAAWESIFSLWAAVSSGTNVVYHAAGWLEGGLCASYEKFIMDCDTLQQLIWYMKPVTTEPGDIALDAIREVGPGGHYFGAQHTQERYENGVLHALCLRLVEFRELARSRFDRHPAARQQDLQADFGRVRAAAQWIRRSSRNWPSSSSVANAKAAHRPISDPGVKIVALGEAIGARALDG